MKRLRLARSTSRGRGRRGWSLGAAAALLLCLGAALAVPAAYADHKGPGSDRHATWQVASSSSSSSDPVVRLRRGALESCFGAVGGTPVPGSTATITQTVVPSAVTAVVNLHGLANTFYFIQLVTSGCQTLGFSFATTNAAGNATIEVTAARGTLPDAFVTAVGGGDFQVSDEAVFS